MSKWILPKYLTHRLFSAQDAYEWGLNKYALRKLLEEGQISKLSRGYYQHEPEDCLDEENLFKTAFFRVGKPASICLISALASYNLTDLIGKQVWIMVPFSRRKRFLDVRIVRRRSPQWKIGIIQDSNYWITNLERTLVECCIHKRLIGTSVGIEGIKRALREKKTTLQKIYEMSKKLKVAHRILPYVEVLT